MASFASAVQKKCQRRARAAHGLRRLATADPRMQTCDRPTLKPVPLPKDNGEGQGNAPAKPGATTLRADQTLVARAKKGDAAAFACLVMKHQSRLVQLVSRLVGESDAHDVAQEAFIKVHRNLPQFRGDSAFYTWAYRIAINCAKNHLAARARRPGLQDIDVADAEDYGHTEQLRDIDTPESIVLAQELEHQVSRAINRLPSELREAVILREFKGYSYDEIAEKIGCPIGTIRSRLFRAREAIDAVTRPCM